MNWLYGELWAWLAVLSTSALLVGLAIVLWVHTQYHLDVTVQPVPPLLKSKAPLVSVIIPARNEARNIRRCVQAALAQDYPCLEVIVVDDRSTDGTAAILAEIGAGLATTQPVLHIIAGDELPSGWAGKPHALMQGVVKAQGEWLCFMDADTFAAPGLIGAVMRTAEIHAAGMLTILTSQELITFWEKVILPQVFTALSVGFAPRRVNDPLQSEAVANGQFILIRRCVYDAVGGYPAIRDQIVEDKALAERVKRRGYHLLVADGRAVASTRMYTSFSEIWEGWTKNIYLGMRNRLGLLLFGGVVSLVAALVLPVWLLGGLAAYLATGQILAALIAGQALILWVVLLYARWQVNRSFGISPGYAFSLPLGAALFAALIFGSALKVLTGRGVTWKGRRYFGG